MEINCVIQKIHNTPLKGDRSEVFIPQLGVLQLSLRGSYWVPKNWQLGSGVVRAGFPGHRSPPGSPGLHGLVPRPKIQKSKNCFGAASCQKFFFALLVVKKIAFGILSCQKMLWRCQLSKNCLGVLSYQKIAFGILSCQKIALALLVVKKMQCDAKQSIAKQSKAKQSKAMQRKAKQSKSKPSKATKKSLHETPFPQTLSTGHIQI